ncbi:class D beta-lactamase [Pseudomonas sp. AL03]|uniref:class D beta-lactamase n=1 Tax=Pseudomonas sp. AL03 TaxID=3042230 RepID=UPI002499B533|nr:class D beta-lactamase [Pseudomonas sp. AL03]MDI3275886.1 class D beta-lactamase [Pseudomonas sp. AL03]
MRISWLAVCFAFFSGAALADADRDEVEVAGWKSIFDKYNTNGTIVVRDDRGSSGKTYVYNKDRSIVRYTPASTFKIPHTLFALDSGVINDEFQVFKWNGEINEIPSHNQNQTLRSAMRYSALWVYRGFAKEIGERGAADYLQKINYGNQSAAIKVRDYWVNGGLEVSAFEQVEFLRKLYRNELPFKLEHQQLTKDIMVTGAGPDWVIRSKTGLGQQVGWWVGWVELPTGPVFFAVNIDTPNRMADAHKREAIGREVLKTVGALPAI